MDDSHISCRHCQPKCKNWNGFPRSIVLIDKRLAMMQQLRLLAIGLNAADRLLQIIDLNKRSTWWDRFWEPKTVLSREEIKDIQTNISDYKFPFDFCARKLKKEKISNHSVSDIFYGGYWNLNHDLSHWKNGNNQLIDCFNIKYVVSLEKKIKLFMEFNPAETDIFLSYEDAKMISNSIEQLRDHCFDLSVKNGVILPFWFPGPNISLSWKDL